MVSLVAELLVAPVTVKDQRAEAVMRPGGSVRPEPPDRSGPVRPRRLVPDTTRGPLPSRAT
jgi:hypothetical protein